MPINTECVLKDLRSGKFWIHYDGGEYLGSTYDLSEATVFSSPAAAWDAFRPFINKYEPAAILPVDRTIRVIGDPA